MPAVFERFGVRFQYPEGWILEVEEETDGQDITVYNQDGAFWSLTINDSGDPDQLAQVVVDTLDAQYDDLDSAAVSDEIAGQDMVGYDVNFYCLDLTNTAQVRAFVADGRTLLVMWQAEDRDYDRVAPIFRAITTSLVGNL
jgi:hypothetical protein